jgi:uncharacterized protein YybS (DUF2232 family)
MIFAPSILFSFVFAIVSLTIGVKVFRRSEATFPDVL